LRGGSKNMSCVGTEGSKGLTRSKRQASVDRQETTSP
jgi:hypothetical protein